MRIVVCVKQLYDPKMARVSQSRQSLDLRAAELIMNPMDLQALEEALHVREAVGGEVTVLSLGKPEADDVLLWSLAMGADAAYLASDERFSEADAGVTAHALAAAIRRIGDVDALFLGEYAADSAGGQMGARLAAMLRWSFLPALAQVFLTDGHLSGLSYLETTARRLLTPLPAVVTVYHRANKPRFPHGAAVINAYREGKVIVWDADDLDMTLEELAPQTLFRGYSLLPERELGTRLDGSAAEMATDLAAMLQGRRLLGGEA